MDDDDDTIVREGWDDDDDGAAAAAAPAPPKLSVPERQHPWALAGGLGDMRHCKPAVRTLLFQVLLCLRRAASRFAIEQGWLPRLPPEVECMVLRAIVGLFSNFGLCPIKTIWSWSHKLTAEFGNVQIVGREAVLWKWPSKQPWTYSAWTIHCDTFTLQERLAAKLSELYIRGGCVNRLHAYPPPPPGWLGTPSFWRPIRHKTRSPNSWQPLCLRFPFMVTLTSGLDDRIAIRRVWDDPESNRGIAIIEAGYVGFADDGTVIDCVACPAVSQCTWGVSADIPTPPEVILGYTVDDVACPMDGLNVHTIINNATVANIFRP